jgi:hypothetical protein
MKALLLILALASVVTAQSELRIKYEKIEDSTSVSTKPKTVDGEPGIQVFAFFNHPGEKLKEPVTKAGLVFEAYSRNWRYLREYDRELFVLADNIRFTLSSPRRESKLGYGYRSNVWERLTFVITAEQLDQITNAKKVEMRLGPNAFSLTNDALKALRQFRAAMSP